MIAYIPLLFLGLADDGPSLPDGDGKATVQKMCTACHGLESIVRSRLTQERWEKIVDDMVSRGAQGSDEEVEQVVGYLSAHFNKNTPKVVNVNKANAPDLTAMLDISAGEAAAIIAYRKKGNFKSWQDVAKVPGIDTRKIESVKDRIQF